MNRLIEADKLIDYFQHKGEYSLISDELIEDVNAQLTVDAVLLEDYMSMVRTVNKLTQALAESVKHGHWLFYEEPDGYYHTECSECGQWCNEDVFLKGKWHYCPHCGAKMDDEMAVTYYADNKPVETIVIDERIEDGKRDNS